ncbi:MAG TPA: hypothetical protein VLS52_03950 [Rudaea sp.]|nr:hypothetical protein [Rudaea sp.]
MQFTRTAVFLVGLAFGVAHAQTTQTVGTLIPMDEPATSLLTLNPATPPSPNTISGFKYVYNGANSVTTVLTQTPLLCGNTAAATGTNPIGIMSLYYSSNGLAGAAPQMPFVFGAASASPTTSATAYGVTNLVYNGSAVQFGGDPLDALVCYGLTSSDGVTYVHMATRDLFADDFEVPGTGGLVGNSSVTVSAFHLPAGAPNNYYGYTVDVTIPPLPPGTDCNVLDCNFALTEGYDTSVFDPNQGGWCLAGAGAQSCPGAPTLGDININYSNYGATTSLAAPIGGTQPLQAHFVVFRYVPSGGALPASGAPVVMAALFSPHDLLEDKLDDNVATGNNTLANVAPVVSDSAAFATAVSQLSEATDSASLSFTIQDPDSSQGSGTLSATANLTIAGAVNIMLPVSCSAATGNPLTSTCSLTVPLGSDPAGIWDTACGTLDPNPVSPPSTCYHNFATDTTNGTYAPGVSAGVQIVVTDALGKNSSPVSVPVHIYSTNNDPPVVTFDANKLPAVQDQNNSIFYPTYACSVSAGTNTGGCGAPNQFNTSLIAIDFSNVSVFTAVPGPTAAFDELASQTTVANNYTGIDGGNVNCTNEQAADVFAPSSPSYGGGGPLISIASGNGTASVGYKLDFAIPSTAPATTVSVVCSLGNTISDAMQGGGGFPNIESAATAQSTFRIVVNP